jgi:sec-independent protein translocase protein TatA
LEGSPFKKKNMENLLLFIGGVGMQELLLIGVFALIFFGAKKVPEFMKGFGKGIREFRNGVKEVKDQIEAEETEIKR